MRRGARENKAMTRRRKDVKRELKIEVDYVSDLEIDSSSVHQQQ